MKKSIKLYEATITNDDVKKIIRELKNSIKEHKKEKRSISAGMGMTWEEWDIFFEYFDNLQQEIEKLNDDKRGMLVELYKANDKKDKYKSRIEKAVEYLKNNDYWVSQVKANDKLLNILNGRSDK